MSSVPTLAARAAPRARADARAAYLAGLAVTGALCVGLLAQVRIEIGIVPITGQTLGVLLVGAAFGPVLGAGTLILYLLLGVVGMPVFAPNADGSHEVGWQALAAAAPTGGYLVGFVAAAGVVGVLSRLGWDRSFRSAVASMLIGSVILYAVGLPWLHQALPALTGRPADWQVTLTAGLYPFVIGDLCKIFVAAGMLPVAWRVVARLRPEEG